MKKRITFLLLALVIIFSFAPFIPAALANTAQASPYSQRYYLETNIMMTSNSRQALRGVDTYSEIAPSRVGALRQGEYFTMGEMDFTRGLRFAGSDPQTAMYDVTNRGFIKLCGLFGGTGEPVYGTLTITGDGKVLGVIQTDGLTIRRVEVEIPEGVWQVGIVMQKTGGDRRHRLAFADPYFAAAAVPPDNMHSPWAARELARAKELEIIPESLRDRSVDYRRPITRAEFAGLAVKTFEFMSISAVKPAQNNPFNDTNNEDVLKAYNVGLMGGMSATMFEPDTQLNREQTATALTRVFKRITMQGWTLDTDADYPLTFARPALFNDDAQISPWARESVYFMAARGVMEGMGGNMFQPQTAASREQAILIALRLVEN